MLNQNWLNSLEFSCSKHGFFWSQFSIFWKILVTKYAIFEQNFQFFGNILVTKYVIFSSKISIVWMCFVIGICNCFGWNPAWLPLTENSAAVIFNNYRILWTWEKKFAWFAYKRHKLWNFEKKSFSKIFMKIWSFFWYFFFGE